MRKIPPELREDMANDPFYLKCCIADSECKGRIEWHHNFLYAGKQVNDKFCILPVCHHHHDIESRPIVKAKLNQIMLSRATPETLAKYPGKDWVKERRKLEYIVKNSGK